jgi:K+-transporting ATPase KdpF subunit
MYRSEPRIFRAGPRVHSRVRAPVCEGGEQMIESIVLGLVIACLFVYLVYALLQPEKF